MIDEDCRQMSIPELIRKFISWFPQITKEESDYIAKILRWFDEKKSAFMFAKRIFESED